MVRGDFGRIACSIMDSLVILASLDGIASRPPGLKTTQQRIYILVALLDQFQRHPGAGALISSSAVGDDKAVLGNR